MARSRVGLKKCNQRKNQQRDEDTDESDEEYKVTDDEDFDESDERYSIDGDESEEISADFGKSMRVSRSRNTRTTSSSKKVNEIKKKRRKRRRVSYTEDGNDDEVADEDDAEYVALDWKTNQINKPIEKKNVSYTGMDDDGDDDGEDYKRFVCSGRNSKQRKNHRKKKRVAYTEDEDDDDDDEKEVVADEDDAEFMSWDIEANQVNKPMERKRDSYTEVDDDDGGGDDDDDYKESLFLGRNRKQRTEPQEKKMVVYTDDDDDEQVADEDDAEFMSFGRKANQIKTPTAMRRDSFTEKDDDDDDDDDDDNDEEEDDDDEDKDDYAEYVSSGRKRNQREKLQAKKVVYAEVDEDKDDADDEYTYSGRKVNQKKNLRGKSGVSYTEEEDDNDDENGDEEEDEYDTNDEYLHSSRKVNQKKNLRGKSGVIYTEEEEEEEEEYDDNNDDEDEDKYMYSSRKVNQKKNLRGKREVSHTEEEEEDDDLGFMSSSRKRNQINKRREKRIVSYKEDNQEEEDESDAEFKVSESDFVDDEDESPKIKKNKVTTSHPQKKKTIHKKTKKPKTKNPTKPKQRNHRYGQKSSSSKQKSVTNKTKMENQSKISKRRKRRADWQKPMVESDSDFVSSASSDHEYTISEEEREQMREAKVYCANLRDKLRSSSCGNQEKQPTYEQKKYPIRKGKEKIEDLKDDIGKQVCGICLSEEQKRTMRGVLNCCRHYFCFSCIMEWSKVESRCPLCKQRFTTITKAAKSDTGFDLRTMVIPVPECDQVYEPSEEELRGYLDPYENVICTECQNGGDDALMLLCDICDSSAHTFCVGLGREVPEGNWYCEGCRPTVFGTLNSERRLSNNGSDLSSPSPIPGGFDLNELYVPETPLTQQTRVHTEPNPASTGPAATLRDRRRLHRQIHHLGILNNNNRMNDLVGRSSGTSASSSSGIRLFGSQLDEARVSVSQNDHIFPSMHDSSNFYPRADQFSAQVQNSNLTSADVALPEFKIV